MSRLNLTLLVLTLGCAPPPENKLAVDNDGDGVTEFEGDCDDSDADQGPGTADEDCDSVLTADDCDDDDPSSTVIAVDADCDGVLTADDCDDDDALFGDIANDADCDGALTADDCDDSDPDRGPGSADEDCVDLIDIIDVSCDSAKWYYSVATIEPAGSVELHVVNTGLDDEVERHTLALESASSSGGGVFERELYLVSDYYYEDTATQFACIEESNPNLTWRVDLYVDTGFATSLGCVTWGHDPSFYSDDSCQVWSD